MKNILNGCLLAVLGLASVGAFADVDTTALKGAYCELARAEWADFFKDLSGTGRDRVLPLNVNTCMAEGVMTGYKFHLYYENGLFDCDLTAQPKSTASCTMSWDD